MTTFDAHIDIPLDERLRRTVAAWRARHGVSARRFGTDALGDPGFVGSQMRGRSVRLDTADRVLAYMGYPPLGPLLRGEGPHFHRFGSRVRYLLADLEAWASARRRVSTSDRGRTRRRRAR